MASCDAFVTVYVTLFCTWVSFTSGMHMPSPLCNAFRPGHHGSNGYVLLGSPATSSGLHRVLQAAGSAHRLCPGDPTQLFTYLAYYSTSTHIWCAGFQCCNHVPLHVILASVLLLCVRVQCQVLSGWQTSACVCVCVYVCGTTASYEVGQSLVWIITHKLGYNHQ